MFSMASSPGASSHALIQELVGTTCRCGGPKPSRSTFCRKCYCTLPVKQRREIYSRVGEGYEQAYATSVEMLRERGRIKE